MDYIAFPTPEKMKHGSRLWRNAVEGNRRSANLNSGFVLSKK
jgi:hypothetical protein